MVLIHERLGLHRDAHDTLDACRCTYGNAREGASHDYHPRHGGRYDSGEERSLGPDFPRPKAFGQRILKDKAKWDEDASEGASNRPNKKKNKQRREGSLVANADYKGG